MKGEFYYYYFFAVNGVVFAVGGNFGGVKGNFTTLIKEDKICDFYLKQTDMVEIQCFMWMDTLFDFYSFLIGDHRDEIELLDILKSSNTKTIATLSR